MAESAPVIRQRFFDTSGNSLSGGKLYTYEAGTTTLKTTYTTRAASVANANPIILDSNGECDVFLGSGGYKFILRNSADALQWTEDNIWSTPSEASLASTFYRDIVYITSADSPFSLTQAYNGNLIVADTSGGAIAVSLPEISGLSRPYNIAFLLGVAGNNLTLSRAGTDVIGASAATSKVLSVASVGCHLVADIDKSPDRWEPIDLGTVVDGGVTTAKLASTVISGLTEDTAPAPEADYLPSYDASAAGNKKIKIVRTHDLIVASKTANYTATIDDDVLKCDATTASFTITLPAAASSSRKVLHIKKTDSSANTVTIDGNASEAIDGATTFVILDQYQSVTIVCDGSNWFIL